MRLDPLHLCAVAQKLQSSRDTHIWIAPIFGFEDSLAQLQSVAVQFVDELRKCDALSSRIFNRQGCGPFV